MRKAPAKVRWALANRGRLGFLCKQRLEGRACGRCAARGKEEIRGRSVRMWGRTLLARRGNWTVGTKERPGHKSVGGEAAEAPRGPLGADPHARPLSAGPAYPLAPAQSFSGRKVRSRRRAIQPVDSTALRMTRRGVTDSSEMTLRTWLSHGAT